MILKELIERWKLPMHKAWKKLQVICITIAVVIPSTTEFSEYMNFLPEGYVPTWFKGIFSIILLIGILIPKFTVANNKKLDDNLNKDA